MKTKDRFMITYYHSAPLFSRSAEWRSLENGLDKIGD